MKKPPETLYSLRQVVDLTGISEFTLRGWEGRYRALRPQRTATGRRMYSADDLLRAKALLRLTEQGLRIGEIARLPTSRLRAQIENREAPEAEKETAPQVAVLIRLAERFEWDTVDSILKRKARSLGPRGYILNLVLPLIQAINVEVGAGRFSVAQEHIFSAFLRERLFDLRASAPKRSGKMRLVVATPEGEQHELGILIASVLAALSGVTVLYLGPNVPARDLCDTCMRFKASHLLLSSTYSGTEAAKGDLLGKIHFLERHLPGKTALWLAGSGCAALDLSLARPFRKFDSFVDFEAELKGAR